MDRKWAEPSWSSRTKSAYQARSGLGQDLDPTGPRPQSLSLSSVLTLVPERLKTALLRRILPAALGPLRCRRDGALVCLLALYILLLLDLFLPASSTRPQLRNPRGHRWFWPPTAAPSASSYPRVLGRPRWRDGSSGCNPDTLGLLGCWRCGVVLLMYCDASVVLPTSSSMPAGRRCGRNPGVAYISNCTVSSISSFSRSIGGPVLVYEFTWMLH
jgi:hypothetical protein